MSGVPFEEFTQLLAFQGSAWMTGLDEMVNEMVLRTYTWPRIKAGKSMEDMVQGGDDIRDIIYMDLKSSWRRVNPSVSLDYDNHQVGTTWNVPWTFGVNHVSWAEQEADLNKEKFTGAYRTQSYKNVIRSKLQNLWTDTCNKIDGEFWAQPDAQLMEIAAPSDPRVPYSLPVFINELSDASDPTATGVTGLPSRTAADWSTHASTVMGINPATKTKWQNQRESYGTTGTPADFTTAAGSQVIFPAMSKMRYKVAFDRLPKHPEYSDKRTQPHVIITNLQGMANYEAALRLNQDTFRGVGLTSGQDPDYDKPTFNGIPLDYIAALDAAEIYPTGASEVFAAWDSTANATNTGGTGYAGPRYYFLNGDYMKMVIHQDHFLRLRDPFTPSNQPFNVVQVMDLWNNFICRSRMRQGILYPTGDVVNA